MSSDNISSSSHDTIPYFIADIFIFQVFIHTLPQPLVRPYSRDTIPSLHAPHRRLLDHFDSHCFLNCLFLFLFHFTNFIVFKSCLILCLISIGLGLSIPVLSLSREKEREDEEYCTHLNWPISWSHIFFTAVLNLCPLFSPLTLFTPQWPRHTTALAGAPSLRDVSPKY